MLYLREGLPEESDIVMCTVTNVQHNSVFVKLDEYNVDGLIHISEISPGRIRNIRDFVKEGKKVVCKVLRVNEEKGQVDLSLRRVNESQRRKKVDEVKQEQKAEKIVEFAAKQLKKDFEKLYHEITKEVFNDYDDLHTFFIDVVNDEASLSDYNIDKNIADELTSVIKQRLKPLKVSIKGILKLTSHAPNGVEIIKDSVKKGLIDKNIEVKYLGAGKFDISVTAADYKKAEELLEKSTEATLDFIKRNNGHGEFFREK